MGRRILASLGICVAAAVLEAVCSGPNVEQRFSELQFPAYSLPFWSWFVVGGFYYAMCFSVLFRISHHKSGTPFRGTAITLVIALMVTNALWNLAFFRSNHLVFALVLFIAYVPLAIGLFIVLRRLDRPISWFVVPYLVYLIYVTTWSYDVWRMN